jgi:hypothetical protein
MASPGPSVLVLYESFAVATVVVHRLLDFPMVHMVRSDRVEECADDYDAIVVDPYVREAGIVTVLRRWAGTPVIELCDLGRGAGARVLSGPAHSRPGDAVLAALDLQPVAV